MSPSPLGTWGEQYVEKYLIEQGYEILCRNWRTRYGEIDLIALHEGVLVFIEVKSRRSSRCGEAEESVDERKQAKLRKLAEEYLYSTDQPEANCRFDVVALRIRTTGHEVTVITNAF
jgi:putative endonuclease